MFKFLQKKIKTNKRLEEIYVEKLSAFKSEMKNFSHLDQNFKRK